MTRRSSLLGRRRFQLLGALAAVLVAASLAFLSGADFTSASANAANVFSSGILRMSDDSSGAVLTVNRMVPAEVRSGSVTLRNTGDVAGAFSLQPVTIADATPGFDSTLQLKINDGSVTVYDGPLNGLTRVDLGIWRPEESHTYTCTVTFPDGDTGADNSYQGATTTAHFDWVAVSVPDGTPQAGARGSRPLRPAETGTITAD